MHYRGICLRHCVWIAYPQDETPHTYDIYYHAPCNMPSSCTTWQVLHPSRSSFICSEELVYLFLTRPNPHCLPRSYSVRLICRNSSVSIAHQRWSANWWSLPREAASYLDHRISRSQGYIVQCFQGVHDPLAQTFRRLIAAGMQTRARTVWILLPLSEARFVSFSTSVHCIITPGYCITLGLRPGYAVSR